MALASYHRPDLLQMKKMIEELNTHPNARLFFSLQERFALESITSKAIPKLTLQLIADKVNNAQYGNINAFAEDMSLIFSECESNTTLATGAVTVRLIFEELIASYRPSFHSFTSVGVTPPGGGTRKKKLVKKVFLLLMHLFFFNQNFPKMNLALMKLLIEILVTFLIVWMLKIYKVNTVLLLLNLQNKSLLLKLRSSISKMILLVLGIIQYYLILFKIQLILLLALVYILRVWKKGVWQ